MPARPDTAAATPGPALLRAPPPRVSALPQWAVLDGLSLLPQWLSQQEPPAVDKPLPFGGSCCTAPFGFNINGQGFAADGGSGGHGSTRSPNLGSQLSKLNLGTGRATSVVPHGVSVGGQLNSSGLAFVPSVPASQSWALLAVGMGLLAWRRRSGAAPRKD